MKKYGVYYRYIIGGYVEVEAETKEEAEKNYMMEDLDAEQIEKWLKPKVVKLK